MSDKIYVIGHKSPDTDSVFAAMAYANLKNSLENTDCYEAAITSAVNKETKYALDKFGFDVPAVLENAADQQVILVDHNEFCQAVDGIENAKIIEVVDHHKVDFKYSEPILFYVKPWGSSCSLIFDLYKSNNVVVDKKMAGLMLTAVLVDTVITKSPTCTAKDKEIISELAQLAGIDDWQAFGMEIFKVRASVVELSEEEIIKSDFKDFAMKVGKIGIGQVETADLSDFSNREDLILETLKEIKDNGNYHTTMLFITDIINEGSQFLVVSDDESGFAKAFGEELKNNRAYVAGILSRKKQVTPKLQEVFDK